VKIFTLTDYSLTAVEHQMKKESTG